MKLTQYFVASVVLTISTAALGQAYGGPSKTTDAATYAPCYNCGTSSGKNTHAEANRGWMAYGGTDDYYAISATPFEPCKDLIGARRYIKKSEYTAFEETYNECVDNKWVRVFALPKTDYYLNILK